MVKILMLKLICMFLFVAVAANNSEDSTDFCADASIFDGNIQMVYVLGGTFEMGSDEFDFEQPIHTVTVDSFWISKYEITQTEWQSVMNYNPSYFVGENLPVESISWYEVIVFCNFLSIRENLTPVYSKNGNIDPSTWGNIPSTEDVETVDWINIEVDWNASGYRLPTEAEWEFAAKGGVKSLGFRYSGSNEINDVVWYTENSDHKTQPIGNKKPNELGIYDMGGNVMEWCWDVYSEYSTEHLINPNGQSALGAVRFFTDIDLKSTTLYVVLRGGSFLSHDISCKITSRIMDGRRFNFHCVGFRLARSSKLPH
jgi:formylglycine-generating enzyme required for sulfatase activity